MISTLRNEHTLFISIFYSNLFRKPALFYLSDGQVPLKSNLIWESESEQHS